MTCLTQRSYRSSCLEAHAGRGDSEGTRLLRPPEQGGRHAQDGERTGIGAKDAGDMTGALRMSSQCMGWRWRRQASRPRRSSACGKPWQRPAWGILCAIPLHEGGAPGGGALAFAALVLLAVPVPHLACLDQFMNHFRSPRTKVRVQSLGGRSTALAGGLGAGGRYSRRGREGGVRDEPGCRAR